MTEGEGKSSSCKNYNDDDNHDKENNDKKYYGYEDDSMMMIMMMMMMMMREKMPLRISFPPAQDLEIVGRNQTFKHLSNSASVKVLQKY